MKLKGLRHVNNNQLPPVLKDILKKKTYIEIEYHLQAVESWHLPGDEHGGSAVRESADADTPKEAYAAYRRLKKDYPKCEIDITQAVHFHNGASIPMSPGRLRELAYKK